MVNKRKRLQFAKKLRVIACWYYLIQVGHLILFLNKPLNHLTLIYSTQRDELTQRVECDLQKTSKVLFSGRCCSAAYLKTR